MLKNKSGGIYVEAALVMPAAFLIALALIALTLFFYNELGMQVREHREVLAAIEDSKQAHYLRAQAALSAALEREQA